MKKLYILFFTLIFSSQVLNASYKEQTLLETCGVLSAQGIYITYSAIGSLADAYQSNAYDDETALQILSEYVGLTQVVIEQLNILLQSGILVGEDVGAIIELNNIYELLVAEATALGDFISTGDQSYVYIYDSNRIKAWSKIEKLFE